MWQAISGNCGPPAKRRPLSNIWAFIRMLFDCLVRGQVIASNPAHAVRGPRHSIIRGATTVMSSQETTEFLKSIDTAHVVGLRDRALIGVMVYAFGRFLRGESEGGGLFSAPKTLVAAPEREGRQDQRNGLPP
jgi:site-specific recombinase XerC